MIEDEPGQYQSQLYKVANRRFLLTWKFGDQSLVEAVADWRHDGAAHQNQIVKKRAC